jgi:(1->4)-alpha-D-glucan 1-alpha-D-glucosylmutase
VNSLAQTLMKYTAPGVPDLYQGAELWDMNLVDPDNRRPVDYTVRCRLLNEIKTMSVKQVMERMDEGLPKLWTIHHALQLRKTRPEWFGAESGYRPLLISGAKKQHALAYLRGENVITLVPRWTVKLAEKWANTAVALPTGEWRNRLTGETVKGGRIAVEELVREFPVALLVRKIKSD